VKPTACPSQIYPCYESFSLIRPADITVLAPFLTDVPWRLGRPGSFSEHLPRQWVNIGISDTSFLSSLFLSASRHLAENCLEKREIFSQLAIFYKVACLQALLKAMPTGIDLPTDTNISMGLILALDEVVSL
jgi:hypothetical protein